MHRLPTGRYTGVATSETTVHMVNATVVTASGTVPTPIALPGTTIADANAFAPYESMLVSLAPTTVVNMNPDAPADYDEMEVTGNARVDDELYTAFDNTYAVGTTFSKLVGIAGISHAETKVWPRAATDITTP